jgi:hypothetical protein
VHRKQVGDDMRATVRNPSSSSALSGADDAETAAALPKDFSQALANLQAKRADERQSAPPSVPRPAGPSTHRIESPRRVVSAPPVPVEVPSAKDLAKGVTRAAPMPSTPAPLPVDSTLVLKNGAASGPSLLQSLIVPPGPASSTAPLGLKPGSGTPLAPMRTPSPMAIVGGSSLRINSPDKPIPISSPTPYQAQSKHASVPPAANSNRPPTSPKSFPPPAGGPPVQYERAFRQWSSPAIAQPDDSSSALTSGPVTFQVYTPRDVASGRGPMRSLPMIGTTEVKKPSIGVRIAMSIVGGIVVALTAAAVIAVSTEDPKKPIPAMTVKAAPPPPPVVSAEPPPVLTIGDPPVDELPATPSAAVPAWKTRPKPAAGSASPQPPASLKAIAPPPNPYGNK